MATTTTVTASTLLLALHLVFSLVATAAASPALPYPAMLQLYLNAERTQRASTATKARALPKRWEEEE
uniref:Uncharacterized protein n=1 Tax=Oryza glumipatula TaxID=40148 RepID=A0A0D9ZAW9_9ORYZ